MSGALRWATVPVREWPATGNRPWATVPVREWPATGNRRHLVPHGGDTSLCGTTALPLGMWRANTSKPECESCLERQAALGLSQPPTPPITPDQGPATVTAPSLAVLDRHGDIWSPRADGLWVTRETAPFPYEHIARKWGPLVATNHEPWCRQDYKHPGWWICTAPGHFPNGDPDERA
jgi:hypothetical protein